MRYGEWISRTALALGGLCFVAFRNAVDSSHVEAP
jgi:hypothetical protein